MSPGPNSNPGRIAAANNRVFHYIALLLLHVTLMAAIISQNLPVTLACARRRVVQRCI